VLQISEATRLPCRIEFRAVSPTLRTSDTTQAFGFASSVAVDRTGRFYTSWQERISVWSPTGVLLRTWGRRGQGPGEFLPGLKHVYVDAEDRLIVRDGYRLHWYTRDGAHLRTIVREDAVRFDDEASALLDDGRYVGGNRIDDAGDATLHVFDIAKEQGSAGSIRSFAPLRSSEASTSAHMQRAVGYGGGDRLWIAPPFSSRRGYELEQWDASGRLHQTLRRSVSWFPATGGAVASPAERPAPAIPKIHVDDRGLLYVYSAIIGDKWSSTARLTDFVRLILDVIDPVSGVVVASTGPIAYAEMIEKFPNAFFKGTNVGYRATADADEQPILVLSALTLVPNR
jgi:hypothetical protein